MRGTKLRKKEHERAQTKGNKNRKQIYQGVRFEEEKQEDK